MRKLVAVFLVLALPALAAAQCRYATCAPTYHAQAYQAPAYYAPTYQAPTYYNPYATIVAKAYLVQVPLSAYTSVGDDVRGFYSTKQAVKEGILEGLREAQATANLGPAPTVPAPAPAPSPSIGPPPGAAAAPKQLITPKTILGARCASCHNPKEMKRVDLSGDPDKIDVAVSGWAVAKISLGEMPKNHDPLPQDEFDTLVRWHDAKMKAVYGAGPAPLPPAPAIPMVPEGKKLPVGSLKGLPPLDRVDAPFAKGDIVRIIKTTTGPGYKVVAIEGGNVFVEDLGDPGHHTTFPINMLELKPAKK